MNSGHRVENKAGGTTRPGTVTLLRRPGHSSQGKKRSVLAVGMDKDPGDTEEV